MAKLVSKHIIDQVADHLIKTGYKSLAFYMLGCKVYESEKGGHYTDCKKNIYIHTKGCRNLQDLIFFIKHELLHNLLYHLPREKANRELNKGKPTDQANEKMDTEISNYYSLEDESVCSYYSGYSVNDKRLQMYKGLPFEEIEFPPQQSSKCLIDLTGQLEELMDGLETESQKTENVEAENEEVLEDVANKVKDEQLAKEIRKNGADKPDGIQKLKYSLGRYFMKYGKLNRKKTWGKPHKRQDKDIILKGRKRKPTDNETLVVYVDCSGSFSIEGKIAKSLQILENTQRIKGVSVIVKYFNEILSDKPLSPCGDNNYNLVVKDIVKNKYSCIAVLSDSDHYPIEQTVSIKACWLVAVNCDKTYISDSINADVKDEVAI